MIETLPIIIYCLLIVLIIIAIIIGIKLIITLNKVDEIVEDVNHKVKSLDKLFEIVDFTTSKMTSVGETLVGAANGLIKRIFGSKNNKKEEE